MSETYNLIFFPTITSGTEEEVIASLCTTLKVDVAKVEEWFAAGKPTVLMKNVSHDVADRYREAIIHCGANCNVQPSGIASGLSLEPKPRTIDLFLCPSCAYEEELDEGMTYEECPSCGLVVEKWEAKRTAVNDKCNTRVLLLFRGGSMFQGDSSLAFTIGGVLKQQCQVHVRRGCERLHGYVHPASWLSHKHQRRHSGHQGALCVRTTAYVEPLWIVRERYK